MDSTSWSKRLAATAALLVVGACNQSGQTGSPIADDGPVPHYETPGRFSPDQPGGGDTGGPSWDAGNRPSYIPQGSDLMALLPSGLAVTAVSRRGVIVYDVTQPTKPRVVGELPMPRSTIHLLHPDDDEATPAITLVVTEELVVDEPRVPEEPLASAALRLVRIDLADPAAPEVVAQVDLEGDVWHFEQRGAHYFVLSGFSNEVAERCGDYGDIAFEGPGLRAMRVSEYVLGTDGFLLRDLIELPTDAPYVFTSGDAYFVPDRNGEVSTLSWVRFEGNGMVKNGPIAIDGRIRAVAFAHGMLATLIDRADNGDSELQIHTLDAAEEAGLLGRLALGQGKASLELLPGARRLLVGGAPGQNGAVALLVDVGDPHNPAIVQQFPADTLRLVSVPQGLLALGGSDTGHLVATLWSLSDSGALQQLGRLASPWPWANQEPGYEAYRVDVEHGLLLVPISLGNAEIPSGLGVARFDASEGVRVLGQYALHEDAYRPISDGVNAYSLGYAGLDVVPLALGAMESSPTGGHVTFFEPPAIARLSSGGRELTLFERTDDGRYVVEVAAANGAGEATTIELDHRGDGLVAVGDRVAVLGLRWDSECQYMEPNPDVEAKFDACAPYRGRGITLLDVQGEPSVVATFELANDRDVTPIDGVTAEAEWSGYAELPDGRLAFPVQQWQRCGSYESCEALDTPAYEGMASPGCNPQTQNCAELPKVEIFVSGAKSSLLLYVLDDAGGEPALTLGATIEGRFQLPGEGPLDIGWQLLRSDEGIAFAREEPVYNAEGNSVNNEHDDAIVQFFLDRIAIDDDGALDALPSVNTPGRPVAWHGKYVYTIEPAYDDEGEVFVRAHRSLLRDDAAHIEASVDVGNRFLDAREVDGQLIVLRGLTDPCDENARAGVLSVGLDADALDKSDVLELPTPYWGFRYGPTTDADGHLVLRGGPLSYGGGHAVLELAGGGEPPSIVRYTNEPLQ